MISFKKGEQMLCCENERDITGGKIYIATSDSDSTSVYFKSDVGSSRMRPIEDYKKVEPTDGIEVGDVVEQTMTCSGTHKGQTYAVGYRKDGKTLVIGDGDGYGCDCASRWKLISKGQEQKKGGEEGMLKVISDNFEKTADALLVQKHIGSQLKDDFIEGLIVAQHKDAILEEAERLEAVEVARKEA